jgi:hypothetical protein
MNPSIKYPAYLSSKNRFAIPPIYRSFIKKFKKSVF